MDAGFDVPTGFVVTADAYDEWLARAGDWRALARQLPHDDPPGTAKAAEAIREQLRRTTLPYTLAAELRSRLENLPPETTFAVRSSSTLEDLAEAAFAGQHDTFLNCRGAEAVCDAVHRCFISLWTDRAIAYRHRHGFDHAAARMAVVVQELIPCAKAGVGFSINPVSGDLGCAVIDANFGLGESVVGGECEVDHWEVDKATGVVRSAAIARKTTTTGTLPGGGVCDRPVAGDLADTPVLTTKDIGKICVLLRKVEQHFRFPQDIEWGIVGSRLVLLQSRPVTTIPARWTRDESAERFPNAITPLTWDFVDRGFHESMAHSFRLMGFPPFSGQWFGKHGHYIYGNQNAVEIYARQFPFALTSLDDLPALVPELRERFRWVQELPSQWTRDLDYYLVRLGEFLAEPLEEKSTPELWTFVQDIHTHGTQYFLPNIAISVTQGILYKLLHFLLGELFSPAKCATVMDDLLAFCETKTGTINKELFELAELARGDVLLGKRLRSTTANEQLWTSGVLETEHPEFHRQFVLMMRNHGHREIDIDLHQPLWEEVPWVALDQIRLILDAPHDLTPAQRERELKIRAQAAEFALFQQLPPELHFFMHEIIRLARVYTSLDDLEHYQTTRLAKPMRRVLRALGRRLVERGVLREPMDLFFAREEDLDAAIAEDSEKRWRQLSEEVSAEKASWEHARAQAPSWKLDETDPAPESPGQNSAMGGLPGSPGVVEGEVFTVSGPADFARFPQGAILVARSTNPSWTPLFYTAGAVITESGGPLSHGAVTARELRIPAVMSVRNALALLPDGLRVRVDGSRGEVTILEEQTVADPERRLARPVA